MVILGLGSNVGDRLENLRQALALLEEIDAISVQQVSPVYISDAMLPEHSNQDWNVPYLNVAIRCQTSLTPHKLLPILKKIEQSLGRIASEKWAPRIIDIDVLAWDELVINSDQLQIPHTGLLKRPFALWPLADVAPYWQHPASATTSTDLVKPWGSRLNGNAPFHTRQIYQRIDTPRIMGIVNVTPDSFSDGGKYTQIDAAIHQALRLVECGAEVVDIGAESTSPHSTPITAQNEWARLGPVLAALSDSSNKFLIPPKISVDTRRAEVAERALEYDIDWLNDVTGFSDPAMIKLAAESGKDCLIMHHVTIPAHNKLIPCEIDAVKFIHDWAEQHLTYLEEQGIAKQKMIFDPGVGFGKHAHQSLQLIKQADAFKNLGARILIGHSRKSFLSLFTDSPFSERDVETLACSLYLAQLPVDYLRVHNVEMLSRGLRAWRAL